MDRGQERRWYQNPQFIWTIAVFVFLQIAGYWKSSNDEAARSAVRSRDADDLKRSFDEFRSKDFAGFQKDVRERFLSMEKRSDDWQLEQRRVWQEEHDNNGRTMNKTEALARELAEFKDDYKRDKSTLDVLIGNARERVGKLEARQQP